MASKNFVILIGGPGLFKDCDPKHDKTWINYVALMQQAAQDDIYKKGSDEQVRWFVFEPPYEHRWKDDSEITAIEYVEKVFSDAELHGVRKAHADKVKRQSAVNYLDYIKRIATNYAITYHGLRTTGDFWTELAKLPDKSISRVWYSGHASAAGLFLSLSHDRNCGAVSTTILNTSDITANVSVVGPKIDGSSVRSSKFYGCGTKAFAEQWNRTFGVPTEGATLSITFSLQAKPGIDVLTLIEKADTAQGSPDWTKFP
jgi:hypothetical protein